ncbi:hypothetical protein A2110_00090 [Candidatus Jorgensenbacteria bacterium GWA1_54_12]|uniref:Cell division protein FtsX n=1 Tax=Candidatus Jorgensenbacteria bacterium GWA1_54_12 TaxID=1798468 RepID=A0A1F6BIR9_9BACT|nr:MAG: hypothetical protein A2110_00090 [Candidatus Jorgensenbacteria bacterium GWA1_54_12]
MITFWRIIKYGFQSFKRNAWLSATTIGVMTLALIVFQGIILFNVFAGSAVAEIKDKVDISVYFKSNVGEDNILNMKKTMEDFEEVKEIEYVSRDEALTAFKERHGDDEVITQTLNELETNPLLASLNIKATDLSEYGSIAAYLNSAALVDVVEEVSYAQNELVITRLEKLVNGMNAGVLIFTLFLIFLAIMVTFNTISLAIFSNKDQIGIMRVVGASNQFIRGPYMVEGIIYGTIAAIVGFAIFMPIANAVSPQLATFVPSFNLGAYVAGSALRLFFYQFSAGVVLGITSSIIAIRRYLKV